MFVLHLYAGLLVGLLATIVGVSGSLVVFRGEFEDALIPHLTRVEVGQNKTALQPIFDEVRKQYPNGSINTINLVSGANRSWSFWLTSKDGKSFHVYADPYTGKILGSDLANDNMTEWIYDLHANLLTGDGGRLVNGIGAILVVFLCVSGLIIWWPGRRHVRRALVVKRGASWKRFNYDLHSASGFWSALLLALVSLTGVYFTFPRPFEIAAQRVTGTSPADTAAPRSVLRVGAPRASLDVVLRNANRAMPEGETNWIRLPEKADEPFSVRKRLPGEWRLTGSNYVHVDQYSGQALRVDRNAARTTGARVIEAIFPLHVGTFGGLATRVLWVIVGFVPGVLFISGFLMYWNRVLAKKLRSRRTGELAKSANTP